MKCEYCGASMPDPPSAPSYTETYTELREEMGKLEYDNGVLTKDKKRVEDWLISCRTSLEHHQESEKEYRKGKKMWKGAAIFLLASNILWLIALATVAGAS